MKKLFNWILVLAAIVGAFYGVGLIVPRSMKQGSYTNMQATPRQVFDMIRDVEGWDRWHPDFADVRELDPVDKQRRWRVTDHEGKTFEMIETEIEEDRHWQGTYEHDGSRFTYRILVVGAGSGSRVSFKKTLDTRDPWLRARRFLTFGEGATPLALLNALAIQLGEAPSAVKDND